MRLIMVTGPALAMASMALLAACSGQPTGTLDNVQLETQLSASELRIPGDSVVIHVLVTNSASTPRTVPWTSCPSAFEVRDAADGSVAPEDRRFCAAIAQQRTLAPGESAELTGVWRGEMRAGPGRWISAPAGTYRVYGRLLGTDLVSAPVTVQVRGR